MATKPILIKDLLSVERQDLKIIHRYCSITKFKNTFAKTKAETPKTHQEYAAAMHEADGIDILILYKDQARGLNNGNFKLL